MKPRKIIWFPSRNLIIYEFHDAMDTILNIAIKDEIVSLVDIKFGVKQLVSLKDKGIKD